MFKVLPKGSIFIHKIPCADYPEFITEREIKYYRKHHDKDYYSCKVIIQEVVVNDFSRGTDYDDENEVFYFVEPLKEFNLKNKYNTYIPLRILAYENELEQLTKNSE